MEDDDIKVDKWNGDQATYLSFLSSFKSILRIKKVYWTIDKAIPDLVEPVDALERMGTDDERDQDATLISNYEKQVRLRAIDFDVALGLLEKSLGPVPKNEIRKIMNKDIGSNKKILKALKKLHKIYGQHNENKVNELNQRMKNLPVAYLPTDVPILINNMQSIQADLQEIQDPLNPGNDFGWSSSELILELNKKVKSTYFDALKVLTSREKKSWTKATQDYRSAAQRWALENESEEKPKKVESKKVEDLNPVNGADVKNFASVIAAVAKAGLLTSTKDSSSPQSTVVTCWNCGSEAHKANKCEVGWCKNCLGRKVGNPYHNPSNCPNKMFAKRKGPGFGDPNAKRPNHANNQALINMVNAFFDCQKEDSEHEYEELIDESAYLACFEKETADLICSVSSDQLNRIVDPILFDSGAGVSLSSPQVAHNNGFFVGKLDRPILLKFGNGNLVEAYEYSHFGPLLGHVVITPVVAMTLISTTKLSLRRIKFLTQCGSFELLDTNGRVIFHHSIDYNSLPLPIAAMELILTTDLSQLEFDQANDSHMTMALVNGPIASETVKTRKQQFKITKEQFKAAIALHERMWHANSSTMAAAIRDCAWTGVNLTPAMINKIFKHYQCLYCALAKRNKLPMQMGTQLPVTYPGSSISADRVPMRYEDLGKHTGFYVFVCEATGFLLVFLDKTYSFIYYLHKVRLFFLRYGHQVIKIRFDAGSVENASKVKGYCSLHQMEYEPAGVDAQYQNPVERHIQQLDKCVSTNLAAAEDLEPNFWGLCVLGYSVAANFTPNDLSGKYSPWYEVTGSHPDLSETCKFPFGQRVTVAKTKQELRGKFRFTTRNDFGIAIGSTTHANGSTFVYLPSRNKIFQRLNVIAIESQEWLDEEGEPLPADDSSAPFVVVDEDEPISIAETLSNINEEANDPPLPDIPMYTPTQEELRLNPVSTQDHINLSQVDPVEEVGSENEGESDPDEDLPAQKKKTKAVMKKKKKRKKSKKDEILYTVRVRKPNSKYINGVWAVEYEDVWCVCAVSVSSDSANFPTLKEALKADPENRLLWIKAIETEFATLKHLDTYEIVDFKDIPTDAQILPTKFVLKVKITSAGDYIKHKARLVVAGNHEKMKLESLFAPTASSKSVQLIIALVVVLGLVMEGLDIYGAFCVPEIKRDVFVVLPKLITGEHNIYWKLKRTLYGLADSPREFYLHVSANLISYGFKRTTADPCVFIKREADKYIIAVIYVDDFIVAATEHQQVRDLKEHLRKEYTITEAPDLESFIGIHLKHLRNGAIKISQPGFINALIEEFDPDDNLSFASTPMSASFCDDFQDDAEILNDTDREKFRSALGSFIFLLRTRPDLAYAINRLATRTTRATVKDMNAIYRVLKYLKATKDRGIIFKKSVTLREDITQIFCWVDAAFQCHRDGKSQSGYCFNIGGHASGMFYSRSFKQSRVTTSSTQSELVAMEEAVKELEWFRLLMDELGFPQTKPNVMFEDNKSTITLATEFSGNMKRTKHFISSIHYLLDNYLQKIITVCHIATEDQVADILTKPLCEDQFVKLRDLLMGVE